MTLLLVAKLTFNPQVLRWVDRLQELGVRVACLHIGTASDLAAVGMQWNCPVHCLFEEHAPQGGIGSARRLFRTYRRVLRAEQPDAIWVLCLWTLLLPLIWALRGFTIPLLLTACGSDVNIGARRWRNRMLFRYILSRADLVCTTTPEMMGRLCEFAPISPDRRLVLHWGIDTGLFHPPSEGERAALRGKWGIAEGAPTIYMGRILRPIAYYREALAAIVATVRTRGLAGLRLIFIDWASDPDVVREVRRLLRQYGLSGQTIFVEHELAARQLREVYAVSDIALNLMRQDQLGSTIFEALAVGCLVVTTDLPQYRRVSAEGARFWFVRASRVEADLEQALGDLLEHLDEAKQLAVAHNQQLVQRAYRFDRNSRTFVDAIRSLAEPQQMVSS